MGMMGNERGRRGRQTREAHSRGEQGKKERGAYRKRHKVELELFFHQDGIREAERAADGMKEREQAA